MRKFAIFLAAAATPLLLGAPANAQPEGPYAGLGYTQYEADDVSVGAVTGRLGYRFHRYVGVEGEAAIGVDEDSVGPIDFELDHSYAAYGVGFLPVTENFDLLARVGYHSTEVSGEAGPIVVGADDDGLAYGAGAQYMFTERFGVRGEYTRLEGDDAEVDTWGLSGVVKF